MLIFNSALPARYSQKEELKNELDKIRKKSFVHSFWYFVFEDQKEGKRP